MSRGTAAASSALVIPLIIALIVAVAACGTRDPRETALLGRRLSLDSVEFVSTSGPIAHIGGGREQFAILLSTDCQACQLSKSEWARLASHASKNDMQVLVLGYQPADSLRRFFDDSAAVSAVHLPSAVLASLVDAAVVPVTMRLSSDGTVREIFFGRLTGSERERLEDARPK